MPPLAFALFPLAAVDIREPFVPLWAMELSGDILLGAWLFFLGASVGSFLNVVVYRLPRGLNLVHPPSRCPSCLHPIRLRDNVPILSWLLLGGKCRDCKASVSSRYFWIELLMGCLFLGLALAEQHLQPQRAGLVLRPHQPIAFWLAYATHAILVATLIGAALIDVDGFRTPLRLFVPAIALGLLLPIGWPEMRLYFHLTAPRVPLATQAFFALFAYAWAIGIGQSLRWSWQWHRNEEMPRFTPHGVLGAVGATLGFPWSLETPVSLLLFLVVLLGLRQSRSARIVPFALVVLLATLPRLLELDLRLLGEELITPNWLLLALTAVWPLAAYLIPLVAPAQYFGQREVPPLPAQVQADSPPTDSAPSDEAPLVAELSSDQTSSQTFPP